MNFEQEMCYIYLRVRYTLFGWVRAFVPSPAAVAHVERHFGSAELPFPSLGDVLCLGKPDSTICVPLAGYQQHSHQVRQLLTAPTELFQSLGEEDLTFIFHQVALRKISLILLLQVQSLDVCDEAKMFVMVLPHCKEIFQRAL